MNQERVIQICTSLAPGYCAHFKIMLLANQLWDCLDAAGQAALWASHTGGHDSSSWLQHWEVCQLLYFAGMLPCTKCSILLPSLLAASAYLCLCEKSSSAAPVQQRHTVLEAQLSTQLVFETHAL